MIDSGGVYSQRQSRFERATQSLTTFVRSHHSLHSHALQRSASLRSLWSVAPLMLKIRSTGRNAIVVVTRNTPLEGLLMTYNDLKWHLGRSCALKKLENAEIVNSRKSVRWSAVPVAAL